MCLRPKDETCYKYRKQYIDYPYFLARYLMSDVGHVILNKSNTAHSTFPHGAVMSASSLPLVFIRTRLSVPAKSVWSLFAPPMKCTSSVSASNAQHQIFPPRHSPSCFRRRKTYNRWNKRTPAISLASSVCSFRLSNPYNLQISKFTVFSQRVNTRCS